MNLASPPLGVVILAAGTSRRMGTPKLLLPWRGTSVIGHLLAQWHELGPAQITVVLRTHDAKLAAELDRLGFPSSNRITNPHPERGMFSSVICASAWNGWQAGISHWAIVLGDQPHLQTTTLRDSLKCSAQNPAVICQPAFGDRLGHPVILPRTAFALLENSGATTLKEFLTLPGQSRLACPVADPGLLADMDTPEDYERLKISRLRS
jgi:molybdenum cofactor cytidylyltransferase